MEKQRILVHVFVGADRGPSMPDSEETIGTSVIMHAMAQSEKRTS